MMNFTGKSGCNFVDSHDLTILRLWRLYRKGAVGLEMRDNHSGVRSPAETNGIGDRQIVSLHGPGDVRNFQNAFLEFSDYDIRTVEERHGARRSPAVGNVKILSYPVVRALAQS